VLVIGNEVPFAVEKAFLANEERIPSELAVVPLLKRETITCP
jgi:hypothetical protein